MNFFFSERDQNRDTKKEQALNVTFSEWLVYCPKWALLIGNYGKNSYYIQEFWIEKLGNLIARLVSIVVKTIIDSHAGDKYASRSHPLGTCALLELPSIQSLGQYFQAIQSLGESFKNGGVQISTLEITAVKSVSEERNYSCKQCCAVKNQTWQWLLVAPPLYQIIAHTSKANAMFSTITLALIAIYNSVQRSNVFMMKYAFYRSARTVFMIFLWGMHIFPSSAHPASTTTTQRSRSTPLTRVSTARLDIVNRLVTFIKCNFELIFGRTIKQSWPLKTMLCRVSFCPGLSLGFPSPLLRRTSWYPCLLTNSSQQFTAVSTNMHSDTKVCIWGTTLNKHARNRLSLDFPTLLPRGRVLGNTCKRYLCVKPHNSQQFLHQPAIKILLPLRQLTSDV